MKKKVLIPILLLIAALSAGLVYLYLNLDKQKKENKEMQELAELDKQEMENEYQRFADQYSEMKTQINNDSIVAQLTQEQMKTQQLLKELQQVKANDAREITRLKKELATVRAVMRTYIIEIDSLNRVNGQLKEENTRVKTQYTEATRQIENLNATTSELSHKVAVAAQLNATGISMSMKDKRGKKTNKVDKAKSIQVTYTIARNVTAQNGVRSIYTRVQTPGGETLSGGGSFPYENKNLKATMRKDIEYTGEETTVTVYHQVSEFLSAGTYTVSIFADGKMIGSRTFSFE